MPASRLMLLAVPLLAAAAAGAAEPLSPPLSEITIEARRQSEQ